MSPLDAVPLREALLEFLNVLGECCFKDTDALRPHEL